MTYQQKINSGGAFGGVTMTAAGIGPKNFKLFNLLI